MELFYLSIIILFFVSSIILFFIADIYIDYKNKNHLNSINSEPGIYGLDRKFKIGEEVNIYIGDHVYIGYVRSYNTVTKLYTVDYGTVYPKRIGYFEESELVKRNEE